MESENVRLEEMEPFLGEEEARVLGQTDAGRAASAVMLAVARAARSFLLYDPSNEAIRHFLEAVRATWGAYFPVSGDLDLKVRPFEMTLGNEVVYLDTDRERSLAFRLYRDGVRRFIIQADVDWHEILKFLEVVSVRYTGIRQTEDDMVVLLWKAGFQHIQFEAIEGVAEDEGAEPMAQHSAGHQAEAPEDFDLPPPVLPQGVPVQFTAIPDVAKDALCAEDASTAVPDLCVRLADALMSGLTRPRRPLAMEEVVPIVRELRDFLLAEGTLDPAIAVVRRLLATPLRDPVQAQARDELAKSFLDVRGISRLLRSIPRDIDYTPPELLELLDSVPGDHLPTVFQAMEAERNDNVRRAARRLIGHYVPTRAEWMMAQIPKLDDFTVVQLVHAIAEVHPDRGADLVNAIAERADPALQDAAMAVLANTPLSPQVVKLLNGYVTAPSEATRLRALEVIGKRVVRLSFPVVLERVRRDWLRLSDLEAATAGETLARVDPARALTVFQEWLTPPKFFQLQPPGTKTWTWVAVSGLVLLPGDDAEKLIRSAEKQAEKQGWSEVARHCVQSMIRRRRLARGGAA